MAGPWAIALTALMGLVADEPVYSGPQPGEKLQPLTVVGAVGAEADQKIDLLAEAQKKPTVLVFVHERTRPAFGLANAVMRLMAKRGPEKIGGGMVLLTDDPTEAAGWMNRIQNYFPEGVSKGISPDGIEGPGTYGLNRNVAVTVLVARQGVVTDNFAMVQPSLQVDAPKIFAAIARVLGEPDVPTVAEVTGERMERDRSAGRPQPEQDPRLRELLGPLIQKAASEEQVVKAAERVEAWAAEHPQARQQIGDIARRIIAAERLSSYGTPKAQTYLKKWAEEFRSADEPRPDAPKADAPNTEPPNTDAAGRP